MTDLPGLAIYDYYENRRRSKLYIHNSYGPKEVMPVALYFREAAQMPQLELTALEHCRGKVLDIGAGAGSHALELQKRSMDVTALDISPLAAKVMQLRGVEKVVAQNFFSFNQATFDTLLLLMNGIGLSADVSGLRKFLKHARRLLNDSGQLLFDSSDVAYLYGNTPETGNYYGEIFYRYEYKKQKTDWFSWLYIDRQTLTTVALEEGWKTDILLEDNHDQYLARLVMVQ